MISLMASLAGRFILAPLVSLWRWLTADPIRMAFAAVIALCGFLALRLSMVDGDRDDWRDKARAYEAASKAIVEADKKADAVGAATAKATKGTIDAEIDKARAAAGESGDPVGAIADSLRTKGSNSSD